MANGIHERGERKRKKFKSGTKACRDTAFCPNHKPNGTASTADKIKPMLTRHKEAMISLIIRPAASSSLKLLSTAEGEGSWYSGTQPERQTNCHISPKPKITSVGRRMFLSFVAEAI